MVNEKLKSYMECEDCWKTKNCSYYNDVKDTIKKFEKTPLNIHFPLCNEHESYLHKKYIDIESSTPIPYFNKI